MGQDRDLDPVNEENHEALRKQSGSEVDDAHSTFMVEEAAWDLT